MKKRDAVLPGSGIDWYSKDFADCVLEDDPECAANSTDHVFIRSIPYFCGQHADCLVSGSRWALQRAKFIVEYEYSVVGILNQMNETLQVLENYVPRFFAGASQLYYRAGQCLLSSFHKIYGTYWDTVDAVCSTGQREHLRRLELKEKIFLLHDKQVTPVATRTVTSRPNRRSASK